MIKLMLRCEGQSIECGDYSLAADWYDAGSERTIFALLGRTSSKAAFGPLVAEIAKKSHMNALVFDYSGHGESPFALEDTSAAQHFTEVVTVFDWLRGHHKGGMINVLGTSYGGFQGALLVRHRPESVGKLVVTAPAIYRPWEFNLPTGRQRSDPTIAAYRSDRGAVAQNPLFAGMPNPTTPTLVVVHGEDERIPVATTDAYAQGLRAETRVIAGLGHATEGPGVLPDVLETYQSTIASWLCKE
jgi:pimeloyl-ACP methyl ester carboxylesterase